MNDISISDLSKTLIKVASEAIHLLDLTPHELYSFSILAFPQSWGNTAYGFGGLAGQAVTKVHTVVLYRASEHHVFHGGRFAYTVLNPTPYFYELLADHRLPGKVDFLENIKMYDNQYR